ncbi:extracellular solute-binding protein [Anaeromicropila herbilytica]|uniref:Sugar ABC transporter substrate-binding protein n=1 Tax=Anaeromicropila herbilytica TaxID=2785025 RepID=A0A7R7ELC6_9FIRM|nr:extracellular solute-binding protein [Anaeromicropila herbilytica]BCN30883.1 sugar ABC transporter substrate-binding protein [Anaeromicropila herbilytica]
MRNKIRIPIIIAVFFILICSTLVICYIIKKENSSLSTHSTLHPSISNIKNKVVLDYYIWNDEESYISPVIDSYEALHPLIQIKLHVIDSNSYEKDIKKLILKNKKIDLFGIRGISKMVQFINKNQLLDLTSYIQNNDMDVTAYGSMFNDIDINGRYYGIPTRSTCWILVYNKDLFRDAGISYPKSLTWDEYRKLAITLTKGEGDNKIYGGYWVPWCFNFAALQRSSYLIDDDLSYLRESLLMLNNFYNIDRSHISYKEMTDQSINFRKEFEQGKIAMMPQGEWIINMLMQDKQKGITNVNWDIAPMPIFKGQESGITWGQYQFVSIASNTSHPKEAFDFVQYLCGEEGALIYAKNGIIHAYCNDTIKNVFLNTVGKKSASIFFQVKKVQEELPISGYEDVLEAFNKCTRDYLYGKISIDKAMNEFEHMRTKILEK